MCKMPCSWDSRRPAPQYSPMVKSNGCRLDHQLASAAVLFHRVVHAVFPGDFIKLPDGRVGDLDVGNALVYVSVLVLGLLSSALAFLGVFLLIVGPRHDGVIVLVIAFLLSPYGLPLAAIWLLGKVQDLKFAIQDKVYG